MAAVFALSRHGTKFCRKSSFPKFSVPRSRKFYFQRNRQARNQYGKGIGRNEIEPEIPKDVSKLRMIMRPLGFTIMTGAVSFGACSILHYERVRNLYIQGSFEHHWPTSRFPKLFGVRDVLNRWWNSLPGGSKTAAGIIFLNTTVFLLWRIPRMQYFMYKWFTTSPGVVSSITLLSSTFSHMDLWHLAINMFVLWSFAPHIEALLGKEQFIAFYITGGVTASFASTAYRIIAASSVLGASLGASGALLAVLSYVCINQPDTRLALVFLPFFTFSAAKGLLAIVGIDVAGLLFRWKLFDHAAHLGGVIFGAWYLKSGHHYLWEKRGWLVSQWHKIREGYKRT